MDFRAFDRDLDALPVLIRFRGHKGRHLNALMDRQPGQSPRVVHGHTAILEEMSSGGWGTLEHTGWQDCLADGDFLDAQGRVRTVWLAGALEAAERLAEAGAREGPMPGVDLWFSWVLGQMSASASVIRDCHEAGKGPLTLDA